MYRSLIQAQHYLFDLSSTTSNQETEQLWLRFHFGAETRQFLILRQIGQQLLGFLNAVFWSTNGDLVRVRFLWREFDLNVAAVVRYRLNQASATTDQAAVDFVRYAHFDRHNRCLQNKGRPHQSWPQQRQKTAYQFFLQFVNHRLRLLDGRLFSRNGNHVSFRAFRW